MADVYEAHDRLLGRIVAIKFVAPAFDRVRGLVERFRRGAHAAAHLN
jgi:serine/threonine protein kinase